MIVRRSRTLFLGIVLALLAAFSTSILCTWHCATFHDDGIAAITAAVTDTGAADALDDHDHDHDAPGSPMHVAAHAACQGYVAPAVDAARTIHALVAPSWSTALSILTDGIGASALLRPPRL